MLWAWERHEDIRTIDPRQVGVAYLAKTLFLRQGNVVTRPRLQPLQVLPATVLMPVVRIASDKLSPPTLDLGQRTRVVEEIVAWAVLPPSLLSKSTLTRKSPSGRFIALYCRIASDLPDTTHPSRLSPRGVSLITGWQGCRLMRPYRCCFAWGQTASACCGICRQVTTYAAYQPSRVWAWPQMNRSSMCRWEDGCMCSVHGPGRPRLCIVRLRRSNDGNNQTQSAARGVHARGGAL